MKIFILLISICLLKGTGIDFTGSIAAVKLQSCRNFFYDNRAPSVLFDNNNGMCMTLQN